MKKILFIYVFLLFKIAKGQFAPVVGQTGSTAIFKDSSSIKFWANNCTVQRGWKNISKTSLGKTTAGDSSFALGKADGEVVSLGDGGNAILQFEKPIINGEGADFAIFENAFDDVFLELAFVEVSTDGINYVRFPAISNTDTAQQVNSFGSVDATKIYNLAGKYRGQYGTPFDLEELKDSTKINVDSIHFIKIIDVVGSIDSLGSRDSKNNLVNDPFPTDFETGGFDLDAVGVIHFSEESLTINDKNEQKLFVVYPNPVSRGGTLYFEGKIRLYSQLGEDLGMFENEMNTATLSSGMYFLLKGNQKKKIIVK